MTPISRIRQALVGAMVAGRKKPLHEIMVTVGAADLEAALRGKV